MVVAALAVVSLVEKILISNVLECKSITATQAHSGPLLDSVEILFG
jgi:hypothetical protein